MQNNELKSPPTNGNATPKDLLIADLVNEFTEYQMPGEALSYLQAIFGEFVKTDTFGEYLPHAKQEVMTLQMDLTKFLCGLHYVLCPHGTPSQMTEANRPKFDSDIPM